ncbi:hypothetical protein Ssi03_36570 [Sphaerisporangium siamense]|nr:hypothetical protein Ssi03_36570 [Sphaerisporangium siamense]
MSALTGGLGTAAPAAAQPGAVITTPGGGVERSPKAGSPLTNLAEYPKLTPGQLAARVAEDRGKAARGPSVEQAVTELTSTETLDDGRVAVSTYTLAPGADPAKVADSLRRQGKSDVRLVRHGPAPSSGVGTLGSNDCAYGSARTVTCPNSWWSNQTRSNPVVLFNDHSSAAWPVTNAVYKWNQTPNIDSWYTWNNCNPSNVHCVDVRSADFGETGWVGLTTHYYIPPNYGRILDAVVDMNDWYAPTTFTRNAAVTHELGHVLGLGHNQWSGDVMYEYVATREDIGGENPALLAQVYSIDR